MRVRYWGQHFRDIYQNLKVGSNMGGDNIRKLGTLGQFLVTK